MGRPRLEIAGAIHHVWQRGNRRCRIFIDDTDRRFFLRALHDAFEKHGLRLLGYCLMDNHFHLVVETPEPALGHAMRDAQSVYAQYLRDRHETDGGRLFQAPYKNKLVTSDEYFAQLLRYIVRNPVAAGMCSTPEQWRWSSHNAQVSNRPHPLVDTARVTELLGAYGGPTESRYARLFDPTGPLAHIDPDISPWEMRPPLDELIDADASPACIRAARRHGYRLRDIAAYTGLTESTISRRAARAA